MHRFLLFSCFVLARMASRFDARLVIASAMTVMAFGIAAFPLVGSSALLYGAASSLLGFGLRAGAPQRAGGQGF
jgi:hypothetical protein